MPRLLVLSTLVLLAAASSAKAQQPPAKKGAFGSVIKQATGKNGYEELVLAADILQECKRFKVLEADPEATLAQKRDLFSDRQVTQVLRLLRDGLQKPVGSPREKPLYDSPLQELGEFRALARLLAIQQYVYLADGRISEALGNARLGMRLGQAVQTDTMVSAMLGIAMGTVCIQPVGAHLDQLSTRDAEALYNVCVEWLRQPGPEVRLMQSERKMALDSLEALKGQDAGHLIASVNLDPKPRPDDNDAIRQGRVLAGELRSFGATNPGDLDRVYAGAARLVDAHYERMLEQLRLPLWQRHYPDFPDDGSLPARLASKIIPDVTQIGNAHAREQAKIRILACHAAVLRYRWEHNKVPQTLAELKLGELAQDPFTGEALEYQPLGTRYRLVSVGPQADPANPRAINGRLPVSVTPGD